MKVKYALQILALGFLVKLIGILLKLISFNYFDYVTTFGDILIFSGG